MWKDITITELEEIRIKLRDLIDLLDFQKQAIVYTNFEDELNQDGSSIDTDTTQTAGVDLIQYRKKVESFLQEHQNESKKEAEIWFVVNEYHPAVWEYLSEAGYVS